MKFSKFLSIVATVVVLGGLVSAQCVLHDGAANAIKLTINGTDPTTDPNHEVSLGLLATVDLSIGDPAGGSAPTPFILFAASDLACGSFAAQAGIVEQIDTPLSVLLDGINPFGTFGNPMFNLLAVTDFSVGFVVPLGLPSIAFQAVYLDPVSGVLPIRATAAGKATFSGTVSTTLAIADDGFAVHTLLTPLSWAGVSYNDVTVNSNGGVTFGAGSTSWTPDIALMQSMPGMMFWSDLNLASAATFIVDEDPGNGDCWVAMTNQQFWSSAAPAGGQTYSFSPSTGVSTLDLTNALSAPGPVVDPLCIAVSAGDPTGALDDLTTAGTPWSSFAMTGFTASGANATCVEVLDSLTPWNFSTITVLDPANDGTWSCTIL